jgi:hypothetical protein
MSKLLMQRVTWRVMALIGFESVLILSAVLLGTYLRLGARPFEQGASHLALKGLLIAGVCQLCLYYGDLYNSRIGGDRRELYVRTLRSLGATSLVLAALYFWLPALIIGRGVFMIAATLVIVSVVSWRLSFQWFAKQVGPRERRCSSARAAALSRARSAGTSASGVEVIGFVDINPARDGRPALNARVVGTIDDIPEIVASRSVDRVVVNLSDARGQLPMDALLSMKLQGVTFDHLASVYEEYTGKIAVENLRPSWLIFSTGFRKPRSLVAMKRVIDIGAASVGMVLAAPLMLGVATSSNSSRADRCIQRSASASTARVHAHVPLDADRCRGKTEPVGTRRRRPHHSMRRIHQEDHHTSRRSCGTCGQHEPVGRPERPEFGAS